MGGWVGVVGRCYVGGWCVACGWVLWVGGMWVGRCCG